MESLSVRPERSRTKTYMGTPAPHQGDGLHPVSDKEVDGGQEFLSLKVRQIDMV